MTREDAIKIFNTVLWFGKCDCPKDEIEECLKMAIKALEQPRWIPMVRREPTDEEKAEYLSQHGEELCYMLENEMPLNGQEVLVSTESGIVIEDIFSEESYNFENNDIRDVTAWMPLPLPYKAEGEETK